LRLGETMVKEGIISNDMLARALERQIIFGGRLGTNLVEMGAITEEQLAMFLSKALRVPYADPGCFEDVPQEVRDAVPAEIVEKYTCFPIKRERGRVHIAMKDPNDIPLVDELRFIIGLDIRPYIASEIRIVYALEKYYGIKRDLRYISMLDDEKGKVEVAPAKVPETERPTAQASPAHEEYLGDESQADAYGAPAEAPFAYAEPPQAAPPPPPVQAAPPPVQAAPPPPPTPVAAAAPPAPPLQAAPVAPPADQAMTPESANDMLASPVDREQIAGAVVTVASSVLARAALFLVKGDVLTGWRAAGLGLSDETATAVKVSLTGPGIFKDVVEDKLFYKGPVLQVPQNTQLLVGLGGVYPQEAVAFPLIIKGKVVGVLYGDNGSGALITGDIDRLRKLMAKASMSLEILILKNKILADSL